MSRLRSFEFSETRVERAPLQSLLAGAVVGGISLLEAARAGGVCRLHPKKTQTPGGYYPAGFRLALMRRLTLDRNSHISKVRSSSKPSLMRAELV